VSPFAFGGGGAHSLSGKGVGGLNSDEGTLWYSRYVLCGTLYYISQVPKTMLYIEQQGENQGYSPQENKPEVEVTQIILAKFIAYGFGGQTVVYTRGRSYTMGCVEYTRNRLSKEVSDKAIFYKVNICTNEIDVTDSKQPKIHREIHTSLWIFKISRKKSANQKSQAFA
jgi:hypothetical protein